MATASATFHPSNDETGSITHVVPGTLTRAERAALDRVEAAAKDPIWAYRGDETGWELIPHGYELSAGRLRHTDAFRHDTPRPSVEAQPDSALYRYLERG